MKTEYLWNCGVERSYWKYRQPEGERDREFAMDMCTWLYLFILLYLFIFNGLMIAFNIGLISVIHQYELATGIHMSPPSWNSLPLPTLSHSSRLLQSPGLSSLSHTANLQVKIGILHMLLLLLLSPIDGSPPGSPVPGILQARTLEWVVIFFSNAWKWKVKVKSLSRVRLLATPWTAAYQAPPSMNFPGKSTGVGGHCLLLTYVTHCYI